MMKRMISFLLAAVLAFGAVAPGAVSAEAQEVAAAEETVPTETVTEATDPTEETEATDPTEETEPPVIITRGQWLSLLVNTFGYSIDADVTLDNYYTDLYSDHEYYDDIMTAVYYGLVDILPNNPILPDEPATREFAAQTLNGCMGYYPSEESYGYSEAETVTYANALQVAVERGWFALSDGAILPEKNITEAERDVMIADAEAYIESLTIDDSHENGYTFKEGVVEITDYVEIEFEGDVSQIRIYDITQPLEVGDTFVVYSGGLAIPFLADSVTATEACTVVTATDLYFEDAIETMDVQMSMAADPLNFTAAEGAELVFIEEESGEVVSAEYASYAMQRDVKKIFIPKFTKSFDLGGGAKIEVEVEYKNAKLNYNTNVDMVGLLPKASLSVWLDGVADVTAKLSSDSLFADDVEIKVGAYEVPGVGGIDLYVKCDVTGSISMVTRTNLKLGVTMSYTALTPSPVVTAIYESKPFASSINADVTAKIYLEARIGFYGKALPLKGYLFGQTGFKANVRYTTYTEIEGNCTHFAAYFFAEYGAKISWSIIGDSELEFKPEDKYMIVEDNSPIKISKHYEDGVERKSCTRKDLVGTTTGNPSAIADSGYTTSTNSGNSSSGLSSGSSTAYDDSGNVVTLYTYSLDSDYNATITKYNGSASSLSIPTSLDGYPVVAIGSYAFSGKTNLKTVVMPDSITSIGSYAFQNCTSLRNISFSSKLTSIESSAFYNCTSLTTVTLPDTVTTISGYAFQNCGQLQYLHLSKSLTTLYYGAFYNCDSLKSVEIPKSLLSTTAYSGSPSSNGPFIGCDNLTEVTFQEGTAQVADYLFANCPGLVSVTLPDSITSIEPYAFYNCANLTNVAMSDSVTTISYNAFAGCTALEDVPLSQSLTTIDSYAFSNCDALSKVEIPDTVTSLGSHAFYDCGTLAEVKLSKNLTSMYALTFYNCDSLTAIEIPKSLQATYMARYSNRDVYGPFYDCNGLKTVTFEEGATTVASGLFANFHGLTSIVLPDSITSIGTSAFQDSTKLESITLSQNTEIIGSSAFSGCTNLNDVSFPAGLETIDRSAFYNCTSLTAVTLPDSVTTISAYAFQNCAQLQEVQLSRGLKNFYYGAFYNCDSLKSVEIPKSLLSTTYYSGSPSSSGPFIGCDNLTEVTFQEGTAQVADYLFANCPGLVSVTLPDSITSIEPYAFYNCTNLTGVAMSDSVTTISYNAFAGCTALEDVPLSQSLTTIGSYAFSNCDALSKVEIPDTVTSLGSHAFYDCGTLAEVKLSKNLTSMYALTFYNCDSLTAIEIPKSLQATYMARYSNRDVYGPFYECSGLKTVTFAEGATTVASGLFANCPGLENIEIPEGITGIGNAAFMNCSGLTTVKLPDTVTTLNAQAFMGCVSLADIDLPASITTIGNEAFRNCDALVSVNMPNSVTTLGTNAFYDCALLEHIHLSESLTKVQDYTFYNCDALKDIEIPDCVTTIGNSVFHDCDALTTADIGSGVTTIGSSVFYDCDALTTVTMGDAVTTMGTYVFYHNDVLESVDLSMKLTKIPSYSFYTCPKLTEIVIPYYATAIDTYAFNASPRLAKVVTRGNLASIASDAFSYPNVTVFHGEAGSYTETWAGTNGYSFVANESAATAVTLSAKTLSIAKGKTAQLYVTVTPADHAEAVTFKSSDETVATVDANGKITAKTVGTTTIKVMVGSVSASCKVTVTQAITGLTISKSTLALDVPETWQLTATITPTDASNQILQWTSSNEAAATVDENGLITAVGNGTAVITATTTDGTNLSKSCTVTVIDPNNIPVSGITLSHTTAQLECFETWQLTATVAPADAANQTLIWSSSDETVAIVDETGLVTAKGKGTAVITATAADGCGATAGCTVTVTNNGYIVTDPAQLESSHDYDVNCTDFWIYTAEGAAALILTFDEQTNMEEDFDFLHIYDGQGTLIATYTGTALAGQSVEIQGDTVKIQLESDDSGTEWGFRVTAIEALGHIHNYESLVTPPTCTEGGYTTYTCTECDDTYTADATEAAGHSYTETVKEPTCTETGSTTYTCSVCGDSYTAAETEALGHDLHYSQTLYPATCTAEGSAIHTCSRCVYSEVVSLAALGHSYDTAVTPPTCTEQGYTVYTCSVCGDSYIGDYVDATGHDVEDLKQVTDPTCTEPGYTTYTCSVCGYTYVDDEVEALGHSFGQWIEDENGIKRRECTVCGAVETDCGEHVMGEWSVTVMQTCTQPGTETRECVGCGKTETREIPASGHSYTETVTEPACTEDGFTTFTCEVCADSYRSDYVEALGHSVEEGTCIRCETVFVRILTQPEDVTAADGEIIQVVIEAEGEGLTYAWYFRNAGSSKFSRTNAFKGNIYSMAMSEARSGRQIYCVITDENGYSVTTGTVTLNMVVTPLEILRQPENAEAEAGELVEVSVEASGDGLTYEWYFMNAGGKKFSKTASFTGPAYYVAMSEARSGRQIYCVITDKYGSSLTTETVTLSMVTTPLAIVTQPEDVTAPEGEIAEVTVEATGDDLRYEWYYRNADSSRFRRTGSFTGPAYYVAMSAARDRRQVYCVITDKYGSSVTTETVTLSMEKGTALEITRQPENVTVAAGETAEVTVEAVGEELTYEWYFMNAGGTAFSKTSTFTGNTYSITMSAARDRRQVYCVITDKYGNSIQTETVTLSMAKAAELEILTQPESMTVVYGETAKVTVEAVGDGLTYEWYYKNAGSSKFTKTDSFTGPTYTLTMNASRSGRHVYCVITDAYGSSVTTDIVTLNMVSELEMLSQPEDVAVAAGETAVVTVDAVGEELTYVWYYRNAGATAFTKTGSFTGDTYSLKMTASRSGRQVYCVITDSNGSCVATDIVTLNIA